MNDDDDDRISDTCHRCGQPALGPTGTIYVRAQVDGRWQSVARCCGCCDATREGEPVVADLTDDELRAVVDFPEWGSEALVRCAQAALEARAAEARMVTDVVDLTEERDAALAARLAADDHARTMEQYAERLAAAGGALATTVVEFSEDRAICGACWAWVGEHAADCSLVAWCTALGTEEPRPASTSWQEIRPGLYERTDVEHQLDVAREFGNTVKRADGEQP